MTILIGIVGAVIGGFLWNLITGNNRYGDLDLGGILIAIVGAIILLAGYRAVAGRRVTRSQDQPRTARERRRAAMPLRLLLCRPTHGARHRRYTITMTGWDFTKRMGMVTGTATLFHR
ncbi:MAG: GlsB/YeaQ/YmgE family stress response membrane protein [Dehalococcoidia bacterium]